MDSDETGQQTAGSGDDGHRILLVLPSGDGKFVDSKMMTSNDVEPIANPGQSAIY
ncbi:hypothetical protein NX059_010327 [Plenodomus lindquistii]|nr:hypothetical protein NX059_010327 [Plenodomus lindquistii]